ncbi:ubiquinol-cytochrome c reductase iron-sulfur subunit [Bacillus sp. FJAT-45350]|uniref:QcrA and Rieske domain-containing protein n=1 Tax=Bacillus sp. FJAT-45350 TaxID=2011014 RepID=UPI000BB96FFA|nr:Rieske 2Fe-2S domain-containing protein [Bacillus sp. FJAT-45350]
MTDKKKLGRNKKDTNDDMINLVDNLNRDDDTKYNRRAFLKTAVGTSVALGFATVPFSLRAMLGFADEEFDAYEIAKVNDVPAGSSATFYYPTDSDPALLVHTKSGEWVAYNSACTHLMCPVFYEEEKEILLCPCHNAYFNLNGHPEMGPPQRELPKILIEVKNGTVYAVGREYRHG